MKTVPFVFVLFMILLLFCNQNQKNVVSRVESKPQQKIDTEQKNCDQNNSPSIKKRIINNSVFLIDQDSEKTSVSICENGVVRLLVDTLEPLTADEPPQFSIGRIGNDSCLFLFTYSGGAGCCYGIAVFSATTPGFVGFLPTYQSIAEIKDIDGNGLNELVIRAYGEFPGLSAEDPIPPQVAYTISNGTLAIAKGAPLTPFYTAEAQNYRNDIDSLLNGACNAYNQYSLQMYIFSVKNSEDTGRIREADSLAALVKCENDSLQDEDE